MPPARSQATATAPVPVAANSPAPPAATSRALARAGALAGAFVVLASAVGGSGFGERLTRDLPWMAVFALAGLIDASLAATLLDRFVLRGGLRSEIARGNLAAGLTAAGHRLAAGWIASRCLYGADLGTLAIGATFVAIGAVTLLVFQLLHRLLTHYADDQEIRGGNSAVALSHVGLTLALGIIVGHAAEGSFAGWATSLRSYAAALVLALALYPVRQLLVCRLILGFSLRLRGREIDRAIAADRDHVLAGIEGLVYVATALLVTGVFLIPGAVNPGADLDADYAALAQRLRSSGLVTDPWVDGRPRFATTPLRLPVAHADAVAGAAEAMAGAFHEVALAVQDCPALLDDFFALTPVQKLLWHSSAPLWHGIARADVFLVDDPKDLGAPPRALVCELNADTPSGQPEAVLLGPALGVPAARDPNRHLEAHTAQLLRQFLAQVDRPGDQTPTVGIVYPTEIGGDFGLVRLYQLWCERLGWNVVLGSPFNLQPAGDGGLEIFGRRCDLLLRHYKTDWWGERLPLWNDEDPFPDPDPLTGPIALVLNAVAKRRCLVVNPFGSVLVQNKRAMAFLWERRASLSLAARAAVEAHLPPTFRLEVMDHEQLVAQQPDWVLKSDYGCEGEEVLIGSNLTPEEWQDALAEARPQRFVVQRFFTARPEPTLAAPGTPASLVNHGVYLVAGQTAGIYARLGASATDVTALSAAVELVP